MTSTEDAVSAPGPTPGKFDPGIARAVELLQSADIETFESCEGGSGHAYPEPTIRFHGSPEAGWRALGVCTAHGLPVLALRRMWYIADGEPNGPYWELAFKEKISRA